MVNGTMSNSISDTATRVKKHSSREATEEIRNDLIMRIECYRHATAEEIDERLRQLDREWDIERILEANAASFSLVGLGLGAMVCRKWLLLPMMVGGFLLQHALQGWCPPLAALRRMGVRTAREIETERHVLKLLRGDYREVSDEEREASAEQLLRSAEM